MAAQIPFVRLPKVDFFGVLLPGVYVAFAIACASTVIHHGNSISSLWAAFQPLVEALERWPIALFALFISYLIGSAIRAFAVSPADRLCARFRHWVRRRVGKPIEGVPDSAWYKELLSPIDEFPYPNWLRRTSLELRANGIPVERVISCEGDPAHLTTAVFDYWKLVLCLQAPELFAFAQAQESRVRFFVGMFWAGIIGAVSYFVALLSSGGGTWLMPLLLAFVFSLLVVLLFGARLRFVRGEEASQVMSAYLAYKLRDIENSPPRPSP